MDAILDEAKEFLDFTDKMVNHIKKQLWDGKNDRYRFPDKFRARTT
jgi:hypothetical protein